MGGGGAEALLQMWEILMTVSSDPIRKVYTERRKPVMIFQPGLL